LVFVTSLLSTQHQGV